MNVGLDRFKQGRLYPVGQPLQVMIHVAGQDAKMRLERRKTLFLAAEEGETECLKT